MVRRGGTARRQRGSAATAAAAVAGGGRPTGYINALAGTQPAGQKRGSNAGACAGQGSPPYRVVICPCCLCGCGLSPDHRPLPSSARWPAAFVPRRGHGAPTARVRNLPFSPAASRGGASLSRNASGCLVREWRTGLPLKLT